MSQDDRREDRPHKTTSGCQFSFQSISLTGPAAQSDSYWYQTLTLGHGQAQKDDLAAILAANTLRNGRFSFRERLSFTIERGSLKSLLEELREDRLSLKTIIKGLKTQQECLAKEPGRDAQKLAANFSRVQQTASTLFSAMCKCCSCPCMTGHGLLLRLDNRVPIQRVRAKKGKKADEPTTFSLFMGLEKSLQEISVNAYETDPIEESPVTAK